jgi:hypothetical protein
VAAPRKSPELPRGDARVEGARFPAEPDELDARGVASGYAGYALAYHKNWQGNVAVKKKKLSQQRDVYTRWEEAMQN